MKYLLPLLLFIGFALPLAAQAFLQRYEHTSTDSIFVADIASAPDGGVYALATVARSAATSSINASDGIVLRIAANGTVIWEREYNTGNFQRLNDIQATPDGGFILGGTVTTDYFDGYLAKADPAGNIEWTRYLGDDELQRGYDILATTDGGYVLTGHYLNSFTNNLYVAKLDANGNEVWSRRYFLPVDVDQTGFSLTELPSGNVVVAGATGELGGDDAILTEINSLGTVVAARQIDYNGFANIGTSVTSLPGGDLVLLQRTTFSADPFGLGRTGIIVSRLRPTGEEVWTQVAEIDDGFTNVQFNGLNVAYTSEPGKVLIDPDGNIVISCQADFDQVGAIRPQLLKLDPDGNFLLGRSFGAPEFLHIPVGGSASDGLALTSDNYYALIYQGIAERQGITVGKLDLAGQELCLDASEPDFMSAALTITPFNYSTVAFTGIRTEITSVLDRSFTTEPAGTELSLDLGPDTLLCAGDSLLLDPDLGAGFTYLWQDGSTLSMLEVDTTGTYILTVTQDNCTGSDTIRVATFSATLDLGPDQTICTEQDIVLSPTEVFPATYTWNDGTDGPELPVEQPGTYVLTLSDPVCGNLTDTVIISPATEIALELSGPMTACPAEEVIFTASSTTAGLTYSWRNSTGELLAETQELVVVAAASDTFTVIATDGCSLTSDSLMLTVTPLAATVEIAPTSCGLPNGALVIDELLGTAPFTFTWANQDGTVIGTDAEQLTDLQAGTYNLVLADASACTFTGSYPIPTSEGLSLGVVVQDITCTSPTGGSLVVMPQNGTPPFAYSLANGTPQAAGIFPNLAAGSYEVLVSDALACDTTLTLTIAAAPDPTAVIFAGTTELTIGETTQLQVETNIASTDITLVQWEPATGLSCTNCLNPVAQPSQTTIYTVSITDTEGCTVVDEIALTVDPNLGVYIPNVFSPNNDGANDRFQVFPGPVVVAVASVQIFDRWGSLVYDSGDNRGWDGTMAGTAAPSGVYLYQVQLLLFDGTTRLESGDVTLIR